MAKSKLSKPSEEATLAAFFDLENGLALVAEDDVDWLMGGADISADKDGPWKISIGDETLGFEVIPVSASVVAEAKPKVGDRRRWRHARCGGNKPAQNIPCFPLSTGRYSKIELAGYFYCIRSERDESCEEEYVKIGDITIYWDSRCSLVAQRHPQHRWVCLP